MTIRRMVALYTAGRSTPQIAKLAGLSNYAVWKRLKGAGVQMRPSAAVTPLSPAVLRKMVQLYKAGHSTTEIGKIIGIAHTTAHRRLRAVGVQIRPRPQAIALARSQSQPEATAQARSQPRPQAKTFSPDLVRKMTELYEAGHSTKEVSKLVGLNQTAVYLGLKKAGVQMRPPGLFVSPRVEEIKKRLLQGESIGAIAKDFGVTRQAVSGMARHHGFPVRQIRQEQFANSPQPSDAVRRMMELYEVGHSTKQVSKLVGLSPTTVSEHLRRAGVKMRPPGPPPLPAGIMRKMVELYEAGHSAAKTAKLVGLSTTNVMKHLKRAGVRMRPQWALRAVPDIVDKMLELHAAGHSTTKISQLVGLSSSSVRNHLKKAGIEIHPGGAATPLPDTIRKVMELYARLWPISWHSRRRLSSC